MANSTKIAIVGLMILLVVVVAKYVKTGTPVNEGPAGGVAALDAGVEVEENPEQAPSHSGLASLPRKPVLLTSSNGGNSSPIQSAVGDELAPEATAPAATAIGQPGGGKGLHLPSPLRKTQQNPLRNLFLIRYGSTRQIFLPPVPGRIPRPLRKPRVVFRRNTLSRTERVIGSLPRCIMVRATCMP